MCCAVRARHELGTPGVITLVAQFPMTSRIVLVNRALPLLRTRQNWLAWLLLPALLLRALIPAGFMPVAGAGGPYLGFCPGAGNLPPGVSGEATHGSHQGHAHPDRHGRGAPETPHHPECVFSAGAATAFASSSVDVLPAPAPFALIGRISAPIFLPAILRAQSPRGPPFVS